MAAFNLPTLRLPVLLLALVLFLTSAQAATFTWDGGGGDDNWSTADNWDATPDNDGTADLHFAGNVRTGPVMDASYDILSLAFDSGADAFTLTSSAGSLTIQGGGVVNNDDSLQTVNITTITLGASQTWNAASGNLSFGGTTLGLGASQTLTIDGANNTTIANAITGTGTSGITKNGAGTLTLSGNNSYSGATVLNAGTLRATTSANALGAGTLSLTGGVLELADDTGLAFNRNTTVSGSTTIRSDRATSGAGVTHTLGTLSIGAQTLSVAAGGNVSSGTAGLTFGTTTLTAGPAVFDVASGANLTLGAVVGAFNLTKQGGGQLTLNTASTRSTAAGTTTLTAGTLRLGTANALNTSASANLNLNGGTLSLGVDANTAFNGTATIVGGAATVEVDRNTAAATATTHTLGTLSIGGQTLTVQRGANITGAATGGLAFGAATLTGAATFDVGSSALLTFNSTLNNGGNLLTIQGAGNTTASGIISGSGGLTKNGTGTLTLTAVNTYAGSTTINLGAINLDTDSTLGNGAGTLNFAGGSLNIAADRGAGANILANPLDLAANATIAAAGGAGFTTTRNATFSGTFTGSAGTLTLRNVDGTTVGSVFAVRMTGSGFTFARPIVLGQGGDTGTVQLTLANATGTQTFDGVISGAGSVSRSIAAGTTILSGDNTYSGGTTLTTGSLGFGISSTGGPVTSGPIGTGTLTISGSSTVFASGGAREVGNAITFTGGPLIIGGANDLTLSGNIALGTATRTIQVDNSGASILSGAISGTVGLSKTGAGTLVISGTTANTFSGTTTVANGRLELGKTAVVNAFAGALAIGDGTGAANSAELRLTTANQQMPTGTAVTIDTDGLFALNGNDQTIGTLSMTAGSVTTGAGTLTLGGNVSSASDATSATISGNLNLGGATRTFTIDNGAAASDMTISAIISNGGLTKAGGAPGDGTLTLSGANTYSGATTINGGLLSINSIGDVGGAASALGTPTSVANGTIKIGSGGTTASLQYTGSGHTSDRVIDLAGTSGGATLDASGSGALVLTSDFTATGAGDKTLNLAGSSTAANTISGAIVNNSVANTTAVTKSGAGTWVLSGNNSFTGGLDVQAGTIVLGHDNAAGIGGTLNLDGGVTVQGSGGLRTIGNNLTLGAAGTITFSGTDLTFTDSFDPVGNRTFIVDNTTTFSGVIMDGGADALTKSGSGTLILSGANVYDGVTTVSSGVLSVTTLANGGTASSIGDSANAAANLVLNGGTLRYTGGAVSSDRLFSIGTSGGTLDASGTGALNLNNTGAMGTPGTGTRTLTLTGSNTDDNTLAAVIGNQVANATSLTKSGSGTWVLSGNNTFTGGVNVNQGTLKLGNVGALNSTTPNAVTMGGGTLSLNGNSVTISSLSGSSGTIENNLAGTATLTISQSGNTAYSGTLADGGAGTLAVVKSGAGTLTLNSASTYTGGTTLSQGALQLGADNALGGSGSGFTFAGGTLNSADQSFSIGALSLTADSTLNLGAGSTADLTFASATRSGGVLLINNWTGSLGGSGTANQIFITSAPDLSFLNFVHFNVGGDLYFGEMIGGNELVASIAAVPEPINVALGIFGVVFAGIGFVRRFRKGKAEALKAEIQKRAAC